MGVKCTIDPIKELGCSLEDFKEYLEAHFYDLNYVFMTWSNYGKKEGWQLDHIQPLSSFDLSDTEEAKLACKFFNIQPLWKMHNQEKGDRLDWEFPGEEVPF
jgi:hypothetical protein